MSEHDGRPLLEVRGLTVAYATDKEPVVAVKRETAVKREARATPPSASECHIKLLSLCF